MSWGGLGGVGWAKPPVGSSPVILAFWAASTALVAAWAGLTWCSEWAAGPLGVTASPSVTVRGL